MKLYYPINVDLYNVYPLKKMDAQQGNIGRGVLVTLTAAGQVIELEGEMVALWAKKPDGTVSYLPCQVVDGKIKADFTDQMLAVTGSVSVELQMINGDDNITTPIFKVEVHRSNIDSSAVESQNEFTALQEAINSVNTALEDVEELKKTGLKGDKGDQGEAATIQVGSVSAGEPGAAPEVNNSGTASAAVFDFVLPRGGQGPPGKDGEEQVFFGAYADFPEEGSAEILYVDTSDTTVLRLYRWNGFSYVPTGGGIAALDAIAAEFDEAKTYMKGDFVIRSGELYYFMADKMEGAWDETIVKVTTVGEELNELNAHSVLYNPTDDYLYIGTIKFQYAGLKGGIPLVPILTSATGYNGTAISGATSQFGRPAWYAFDGDDNTYAYAGDNLREGYIGYAFNKEVFINKIKCIIFNPSSASRSFSTRFEKFNGVSWSEIPGTAANHSLEGSAKRDLDYIFENTITTCYGVRAYFTASTGMTFSIKTMQVYGAES